MGKSLDQGSYCFAINKQISHDIFVKHFTILTQLSLFNHRPA